MSQASQEEVHARTAVVHIGRISMVRFRTAGLTLDQCVRLGKPCGYPLKHGPEATEDPDFLLQRIQQLEFQLEHGQPPRTNGSGLTTPPFSTPLPNGDQISNGSSTTYEGSLPLTFPKALFLDAESFTPLPQGALDLATRTPSPVLAAIHPNDVECDFLDHYFSTVNAWFPFISQRRLLQRFNDVPIQSDPSAAALLISMKLVTGCLQPDEDPQTPLYRLATQHLSFVASAGSVSLLLLQATLLVAVYEIGHAIYPAAYLSIGNAARLGQLMGIHDRLDAKELFREAETWTSREEERRTWWFVTFLDRYLHCGTVGLPLVTCEPNRGHLLPGNDITWTQGLVGSNELLLTSTPSALAPGVHCATVCRASHILGRVLRHRSDHLLEFSDRVSEALQLHRALLALDASFSGARMAPLAMECDLARSLCCSARMILYDMCARDERCADFRTGEATELQQIAIEGLWTVTLIVAKVAQRIKDDFAVGIKHHGPIPTHCLHQALREAARLVREDAGTEMKQALETITDALKCMSQRWRVCAEYLKLFEEAEGVTVPGAL